MRNDWSFWEWCELDSIRRQQQQANWQQRQTNNLIAKNNKLLEQIRRQGLTPAERAAEDAQRAAEAAAEAERQRRNTKIVCLMLLTLVLMVLWISGAQFLAICIVLGAVGIWRLKAQQNKQLGLILLSISMMGALIFLCVAGSHPASAAPVIRTQFAAIPDSTPYATEPTQAERNANWQRILDMRRATPTSTPTSTDEDWRTIHNPTLWNTTPVVHPAPRAKLVKRHH
jgi:hypothetical protein